MDFQKNTAQIEAKLKRNRYRAALHDAGALCAREDLTPEERRAAEALLKRVELGLNYRKKHFLEEGEPLPAYKKKSRGVKYFSVCKNGTVYFSLLRLPLLPVSRYECRVTRSGAAEYGHPLELPAEHKAWRLAGILFCLLAITCYMVLWVI